jgi:hypothetical protein
MSDDPYEQWRRLSEHYAQMLDGELLKLASEYSDLTEVAQQALRDEMRKRGLGDPLEPKTLQQTPGQFRFDRGVELDGGEDAAAEDEKGKAAIDYTWKTELCGCENPDQVWQIREVLQRAGIESWVDDSVMRYATKWHYPKNICIQVAADQLDEARRIIAQPIPQDIIDESQIEVPEYESPKCPRCGASDSVLCAAEEFSNDDSKTETTSWVNRWHCESCGSEWSDPSEAPDATH